VYQHMAVNSSIKISPSNCVQKSFKFWCECEACEGSWEPIEGPHIRLDMIIMPWYSAINLNVQAIVVFDKYCCICIGLLGINRFTSINLVKEVQKTGRTYVQMYVHTLLGSIIFFFI
jgi:hypothetical protein